MFTLFTTPKPFRGHIATIQRNAIRSWTLLRPQPEIIVFGDEEGAAEIAHKLGLRHVADVARNEYGTPLLSDLFAKARGMANHELLCFINADIILMSDVVAAIQRVPFPQFLMSGQRWEVDIDQDWDYSAGWEGRLRAYVHESGRLRAPNAMDYFVFPGNLEIELPPFAVGRIGWDNWFISYARKRKVAVIDASEAVMAVHQNHDYAHIRGDTAGEPGGMQAWTQGPEARRNMEIAGYADVLEGVYAELRTLQDATWRFTAQGDVKPLPLYRGSLYTRLKRFFLALPGVGNIMRYIKKTSFRRAGDGVSR
jgi:hypothetical protein